MLVNIPGLITVNTKDTKDTEPSSDSL
jgi:hypothetical protein